ncbi:MAG: hypothetical protein RLZZ593_411 [Bacteroidota bacterium]|jgi:multiple sugar transport system ATP-binding protein
MSDIHLIKVSKFFDNFQAVKNLDLEIGNGEFVALLGPSGCGKTTTMNMIAGLEHPTSGNILIDSKDTSSIRIQDRNIGFVFQNYAIFTHLTVYKNLSYGLEVQGYDKASIDDKVQKMAKRMSISHRLDQPAASLSVNELQKLAIGRSAIVEPKIFLLDEPLSNLDASFRAYMRSELKLLQREFGQTMVYVTHDQIEAMSLADKIAIMNEGSLIQYGPPLEVYNNPNSKFVSYFVGSPKINLLEGHLIPNSDSSSFVTNKDLAISFPSNEKLKQLSNSEKLGASIGIRPQNIKLSSKESDKDINLRGQIKIIERIGAKRLAHVQVDNHMITCIDDSGTASQHENVIMTFSPESFFLFSEENGNRLI